MRFCTSCGEVAPLTCVRCGTRLSRRDRTCRLCGAPTEPRQPASNVSPTGKTESFPPVSPASGFPRVWVAVAALAIVGLFVGAIFWAQRPAAGSTPGSGTPALIVIQLPSATATHPALGPNRTRVPNLTLTSTATRPAMLAPKAPARPSPTASPSPSPAPSPTRIVPKRPATLKGKIAFKSDRSGRTLLYVMNPDGTEAMRLPDDHAYYEAQDRETISPDGLQRLRVLDNNGSYDVYVGPADEQSPPTFITSNAAHDYDPVWSPSGDRIAFVSLRQGRDDIFVMTPDGRNDKPLTNNRDALDKHPSWSPDGAQIVFGSDRDGRRQVYVMNADGTNQINISGSRSNDWDPIWLKR